MVITIIITQYPADISHHCWLITPQSCVLRPNMGNNYITLDCHLGKTIIKF